jgi:hypothetical protein
VDAKYVVTVFAPDQAALLRLGSYGFDLLHQSAAVSERRVVRLSAVKDKARPDQFVESRAEPAARETSIDGLLTLEQVRRLVADGYSVLVREDARKRARAHQLMDFQSWLKAVSEK